jgi:hypothetical protein
MDHFFAATDSHRIIRIKTEFEPVAGRWFRRQNAPQIKIKNNS